MVIREDRIGEVVVLRPNGRMTVETFGGVREAVRAAVDEGARHIVINLQEVPYADSIGIAELVRAHAMLRLRGGMLRFCSLSRPVEQLLVVSGLSRVLDLHDTESAALRIWPPSGTAR
jgi:anti-anti-sigma factor